MITCACGHGSVDHFGINPDGGCVGHENTCPCKGYVKATVNIDPEPVNEDPGAETSS